MKNLVNDFIKYEGKLGIEYIKTHNHAPEDFEVNGYLNCDPHYENIIGKGHLENISGNIYSCILNMTFDLNLEEINLNIDLPGLSNDVHVEILQTVLKNKY